MFRLKKGQPEFEVVDGPMTGRKFLRGVDYAEVPPGEKRRFDEIKQAAPKAVKAPAPDKAADKEGAK